jgi:hypothetical protein
MIYTYVILIIVTVSKGNWLVTLPIVILGLAQTGQSGCQFYISFKISNDS